MSLRKRIKAWRILRLTKSYPKRFPAPAYPEQNIPPGKIELTKRIEFNQKVIRMIVSDKELAERLISLGTGTGPEEYRKPADSVIEYAH